MLAIITYNDIYGDQAIPEQLKKHVYKRVLAILTTYMETRLSIDMMAALKSFQNTVANLACDRYNCTETRLY